jgi:riboflavin synthase
MFTGIVEELGIVHGILKRGDVTLLSVQAAKILDGVGIGDSVAVNGVCLTVVKYDRGSLYVEMMPETASGTNLGLLKMSGRVNLERSLKVGDRISGHFVSGHIDCMGVIRRKARLRGNLCCDIAVPPGGIAYIVRKGSIAVDGISLTIVEKRSNVFSVYIIPHTMHNTTLMLKGPSDRVNIEFDMLMKRAVVKA